MAATETKVVSGSVDAKVNTGAEVKKSETVTVDLHNPTRATRIIYDGIPGSMKQIAIEPLATKRGVTISRGIAEELRDRNRAKKNSDLIIKQAETEAA